MDPGHVTVRRLNRTEYNNTVHDLLGTSQTPADTFTADPTTGGFDNNGDALTLSDTAMALYESAAEALASEAANPNNPNFAKLVPCVGGESTCINTFVSAFGQRAWRRPLTQDETLAVVTAASNPNAATNFSQQVGNAIQLMLMSPNFLFKVELDPSPTSTTPHPLSAYELATRLSYLVWSSTPDGPLMQAADNNSLLKDDALLTQLQRMLQDPKAQALTANFAGQWLELRNTQTFAPDPNVFPNFDEALRSAMLSESSQMFNDVLQGTLPVDQMLLANYTYVNNRLAMHYGLPAVNGNALVKVDMGDNPRRGFLGQAAVLTSTSFPTRTSLVHRGQYVLSQLLCSPPPPPPPNVPTLDSNSSTAMQQTQRQRLEAHAQSGACAACHNSMDPYGFVLETYDGIGAARTMDNGLPIDPNAVLPSGQAVSTLLQLAQVIHDDPRYTQCVTQQLFTYGLGRVPTDTDSATMQALHTAMASDHYRFDTLLKNFVLSDAFRTRRGEAPSPNGTGQ